MPVLSLPNANQTIRVGVPFSYDATQDGRTVTDADRDRLTYNVTFEPDGLGLTATGGFILGTPSLDGDVTAIVSVSDTDGNTIEDRFQIMIVPRQAEQVFVTQEAGVIDVFVKGSIESSNKYLRYQFVQFDEPAQRARGWTWRFLDEATLRQGDEFTIGTRLLRGGENFVAVREVGKSDFMGGLIHGDYVGQSVSLLIDGEEQAIDGRSRYIGKTVEIKLAATLYEVDAATLNPTANLNTNFQLTFEKSTLSNRVEFLRPVELSSAFTAMLSVDRYVDADPQNTQLTSVGNWPPAFEDFDISQEAHGAPIVTADELNVSGLAGFSFNIKMVEGWEADRRRSYISGSPSYNKLYFSPIGLYESQGPGLRLTTGDVIESVAEYRLDTTN